jgi:hypothetical protein
MIKILNNLGKGGGGKWTEELPQLNKLHLQKNLPYTLQ